jgi:hypothetical protein
MKPICLRPKHAEEKYVQDSSDKDEQWFVGVESAPVNNGPEDDIDDNDYDCGHDRIPVVHS